MNACMVCQLFQNYGYFEKLILLEANLKTDLVFVATVTWKNQFRCNTLHKNDSELSFMASLLLTQFCNLH